MYYIEGDTMSELTELVNEPEIVEGAGEADRWQKYGNDRVYLNDTDLPNTANPYIDLQSGELELEWNDTYGDAPDVRMEIEDGVATVTKYWESNGEEHSETVAVVQLFEGDSEGDADGGVEDGEDEGAVPVGQSAQDLARKADADLLEANDRERAFDRGESGVTGPCPHCGEEITHRDLHQNGYDCPNCGQMTTAAAINPDYPPEEA